jgi:pyruvate dehydrogenase E2 component (dihydrolipoamide acetyltransferase)
VAKQTLKVPDIGGAEDAEVIEINVAVGDRVEVEQGLIVLESDKASMEIPAELAGTVLEILVKEGDTLAEGAPIVTLETDAAETGAAETDAPKTGAATSEAAAPAAPPPAAESPAESAPAAAATQAGDPAEQEVRVPDIGTDEAVEIIEISAAVGDTVAEGDSLIVLESDKASMELPAPFAGEILSFAVREGDQVRVGDLVATVRGQTATAASEPESAAVAQPAPAAIPAPSPGPVAAPAPAVQEIRGGGEIYAGPAVRKLARELGVDLTALNGSGPKGRIVKDDVQEYVKRALTKGGTGPATSAGIPPVPEVDFAAFGEIDSQPMTKVDRVTAANMHRSWLNVPHVTQFDEADITELEAFRAELKAEAERRGTRLTPLPFILKACARALQDNPKVNRSISADGENFIYKKYVHIGMAVDTPAGLVVPVIRDVDKKSLWELAAETAELAGKAKDRKLKPAEMQGGCFSISSLGNIGGTGFTPIVNAPEVAILGVSKLAVRPVWNGEDFEPRKLLPLTLSYDHRAVNGADGGRFMTQLCSLLADIRRLLL